MFPNSQRQTVKIILTGAIWYQCDFKPYQRLGFTLRMDSHENNKDNHEIIKIAKKKKNDIHEKNKDNYDKNN